MNDMLTVTMLRKGDSASKVLAQEGWPKNTHQKIIKMKYNKEYAEVSQDPASKLTAPAPLRWPVLNPAAYKTLKGDASKLLQEMMKLAKIRSELETDVKYIYDIKDAQSDGLLKEMERWSDKYLKYKNAQEKLYDQCVEMASTCKDAKIGIKLSKQKLKDADKQLVKLEKAWKKHLKSGGLDKQLKKELADLQKRLKALKTEQEALMKELVNAAKKAVKLAVIMP